MAKIDNSWKADSSLVSSCIWSPNYTAKRKFKIDTIIIHCMAGTYDATRCGMLFANPQRGASSHYGISSDGTIIQYVKECFRAWTTGGTDRNGKPIMVNGWSGSDYDHRAITIEVSNTVAADPWPVSNAAMQSIISLCTDVCRRNGIPALKWLGSKQYVGNADVQNMAAHRWFAYKSCPGDFLYNSFPNIALQVTTQLQNTGYMLYGLNYAPVFDPVYYANKYPDLMSAFGLNKDMLWLHFQQFGMNEFRRGSAEFDPVYYKHNNPDVVEAFGDDNPMYYFHYVAFGKEEGRKGHEGI